MQVDRYVMHQLFELEQTALSSYAQYNFPKGSDVLFQDLAVDLRLFPVISALTNFTNTTLSSLYFDITKDSLYANSLTNNERRSTVTVLQHVRQESSTQLALTISCFQVLDTMIYIIAPVLPHLVEEVRSALYGQPSSEISHGRSVFSRPWVPLVNFCLSVGTRVLLASSSRLIGTTQLQIKRWFSYSECEVPCWVCWNKQGGGSALSHWVVVCYSEDECQTTKQLDGSRGRYHTS
jgi:isoleucyl-tRNA synthetase